MNSESSLARWLRWLIYASAFIPLIIFSQYMSPFHFGKVVVLRSIVEVMAVLYILLIWRDRSYLPRSNPITWAFVAFAAAFTLTSITSVAPLQSFWGTLERMGGLWTFWHYLAFYIIAVAVLRTRRDWQVLLDLMIGVGVASAVYGFLQRTNWELILGSGGRERIFGTIGNPALFAGYQILVAYLALTMAFMTRSTGARRAWYWASGLVMLLAAVMTVVRGSLLGIIVATIAFILLYSTLYRSRTAKTLLLAGVTGVAVFLFLGVLLRDTPLVQNSPYLRRVTDFSPATFTVQTRFWAWSAGFKGWSESPRYMLVGWGPENFNIPFSEHFNPKFFTGPGSETFFDRAHNMFVEILVTMGLAGELTYLAIFVALFATLARFIRRGDQDTRILGIGFTALTIAYIIHNCFIFDTSANFLTFFMLLAYVTHVSLRGINAAPKQAGEVQGSSRRAQPWTAAQLSAVGILTIVVVILIYVTDVKPSLANYATTRAIIAGWQGDYQGAVAKYREAIDAGTPGRYEFRHRFAQYLLELNAATDTKKIPDFSKTVLSAVEDVNHNVRENPRDYLPLLYLSRLYITLGKDDPASEYNKLALENSTKALAISPTFVRTYYEIGQAYLNMKDYDKAYAAFDKARELNPDVGITYWYLGVVDNQRGNTKEALTLISQSLDHGYSLTESDAAKLIDIYIKLNDVPGIVAVYEHLVKQFPDRSQYWASLAIAYARVGKVTQAIAAVHKAVDLDPKNEDLKKQADAFIKALGGTP